MSLVKRWRAPRRSATLVHEMVSHRDALQANVMAAHMVLDGPVDPDRLRELLNAAELDLHALGAKQLEWATAIQEEMASLRLN